MPLDSRALNIASAFTLQNVNIDYMQFNQKNKGDELFAHPQKYYIEHFIRY